MPPTEDRPDLPRRQAATVWERARSGPDELALADTARELTWAAAVDEISRAASVLNGLGLGAERRLAVFAQNSADTMVIYAAARMAGVGADVVNYHLGAEELTHILRQSGAVAIWASDSTIEVALQAAATLGGVRVISSGKAAGATVSWSGLMAGASAAPPAADATPAYELMFTSGTTGHPKAVRHPQDLPPTVGELALSLSGQHMAGLGRHLVVGPLYHAGPHAAVGLLLAGTPVIVLEQFDAAATLQTIDRYRIATAMMVPTHFIRLLALPGAVRASYDLSSLVMIAHSGSGCAVDVKRAMIDWVGPVLRESYGSAEAGIVAWISSRDWLAHPGSVGRPAAGCEAFVVDGEGHLAGRGVEGLLCFRASGGRRIEYHNDSTATREAYVQPGLFTLGEIGYIDDDGYIFLTDRAKDMVVSGGVNIYPAECERVLLSHPSVTDAGIFGVPDAEMGERLVGLVVTSDDQAVSGAELIDYCRSRLAHFKVPRTIETVAELPRTPIGKLNKRDLRNWYLASQLSAPAVPPTGLPSDAPSHRQGSG